MAIERGAGWSLGLLVLGMTAVDCQGSVNSRAADQASASIGSLEDKLRAAGAELPYVINVWGRGYRLLD